MKYAIFALVVVGVFIVSVRTLCAKNKAPLPKSLYEISAKTIDGKTVTLERYKGQVILVVNVASKCGFTKQYRGLQEIYEKYKGKGFVILGFPSNDFGWQEPGTEADIQSFCSRDYGVTFPMFSKVKTNGKEAHPLYQYLTNKQTNPNFSGRITWNFNKFLIDKNGHVMNRFGSTTDPQDPALIKAIEAALLQ